MKKMIGSICVLIIACFCWGCKKQTLEVPSYPLEVKSVENALEEVSLSWKIVKEEAWKDNQKVYTLNDEENKIVAFLLSEGEEDKRMLNLTFIPSKSNQWDVSRALKEEEWKNAIRLGTVLYGGFKNQHEIYDDFVKNYEKKKAVKKHGEPEEGAGYTYMYEATEIWETTKGDKHCVVTMGIPKSKEVQKDFVSIYFYNADKYAKSSF